MKVEGWIFVVLGVFFLAISGIYWLLSGDAVGTTALVMSGLLGAMIAFYLLYTAKRVYPRPEDRKDAEIEEADPEYGFFSPHSWWPFVVGLSTMLIAFGLVFAAWLVVFGVMVLLIGLVGWLFEYYRGAFAH